LRNFKEFHKEVAADYLPGSWYDDDDVSLLWRKPMAGLVSTDTDLSGYASSLHNAEGTHYRVRYGKVG